MLYDIWEKQNNDIHTIIDIMWLFQIKKSIDVYGMCNWKEWNNKGSRRQNFKKSESIIFSLWWYKIPCFSLIFQKFGPKYQTMRWSQKKTKHWASPRFILTLNVWYPWWNDPEKFDRWQIDWSHILNKLCFSFVHFLVPFRLAPHLNLVH